MILLSVNYNKPWCKQAMLYGTILVNPNTLTLSPPAFLKNSCQPPPAFLLIFSKISWPTEYFVVWISEHAIHQDKDQTLYFQKKKRRKKSFYFSFKHCFLSHLNVGRFHWKKKHFEQKAEKITFLSNTTSGSYSVILSKQICSRWLPSVSQSLHRPLPLSGSTFHSVTLGSFHLYAVSVDDRIIFHMHMLTYEITHLCVFLVCVFDRHFLDSFRRCIIAPPSI